jgi:hypothetical protein
MRRLECDTHTKKNLYAHIDNQLWELQLLLCSLFFFHMYFNSKICACACVFFCTLNNIFMCAEMRKKKEVEKPRLAATLYG